VCVCVCVHVRVCVLVQRGVCGTEHAAAVHLSAMLSLRHQAGVAGRHVISAAGVSALLELVCVGRA